MHMSHIKISHTKRATRNGFVLIMGKPQVGRIKSPDWYKRGDGLVLQNKCDNLQIKLILAAFFCAYSFNKYENTTMQCTAIFTAVKN